MKRPLGFTLIELLIYLALFGIILGGVCGAVYTMLEFSDSNQGKVILQEEGNFLLGKIDWALAGAADFTASSSPAELLVDKYNFTDNPLIFVADGTSLILKRGDKTYDILNSSQIQMINLAFQSIPAGSAGAKRMQINFTLLTTSSRGKQLSQDFQSTYYLLK